MAKQDDFVRITLRIPPDLHRDLEHYAVDNSLNAEILRRLRYTVQLDMVGQELKEPQLTSPKTSLSVQLDAGGRSLTWEEIRSRVSAVVAGLEPPVGPVVIELISRNIELMAATAVESPPRHAVKFEGGVEEFIEKHGEAMSVIERLVKEEAPEGMSLNGVLGRIEEGEDPEAAFRAELREHIGSGGIPRRARSRHRQS